MTEITNAPSLSEIFLVIVEKWKVCQKLRTGKCHSSFQTEEVDSKNCTKGHLWTSWGKKITNGLLMKTQNKNMQSAGGSKVLIRVGQISLSSCFPLIILLYQNMDFNSAFYSAFTSSNAILRDIYSLQCRKSLVTKGEQKL